MMDSLEKKLPSDTAEGTKALDIIKAEFVEEEALEWPAIDERPALTPLPIFPINSMPEPLKQMVIETAASVQVAIEVVALTILIITGFAAGRENVFSIKPGLETRPNLFGLVFVERGGRKSASYAPILKPVYQWITNKLHDYKQALNSLRLKQKERDSLEAIMTNGKVKPDSAGAARIKYDQIQLEIEEMSKKLRDPEFIADDTTPEALLDLFQRCQGQGLVSSDDGRAFLKILNGLYSGENREEFHLRGFDCINPIINHRKSKLSAIIEKPFEAVLMMLQIDCLGKLGQSDDLFSSGFLSRCLFVVPDSLAGSRVYSERQINESVLAKYEILIRNLLDNNYSRSIGEDKVYQAEPIAKEAWIKFYNKTEAEVGPGGKFYNIADLAIRFPEFVRKIALIIAITEAHNTILLEDMTRAIILTEYYAIHAERAFSVMKAIGFPSEAQRVLRVISKNNIREFSIREIERATGMSAAETDSGINLLISRHYVRAKKEQSNEVTVGRKPSAKFEVNPQII